MNIFNRYSSLINQYSDSKRKPAQGHDIDGLSAEFKKKYST